MPDQTPADPTNGGNGTVALPAARTGQQFLNVVLHGLYGLIIWPDYIEVLAPQVDEHVYIGGTWRNEFRLKQSVRYQLTGVPCSPPCTSDANNEILFKSQFRIVRDPDMLFCSIWLPLPPPAAGSQFGLVPRRPISGFQFSGRDGSKITAASAPLLHVLRYPIDSFSSVSIPQLPDYTPQPESSDPNTANLHFFAEEEVDQDLEHTVAAFENLMKLFPSLDVQLTTHFGTPMGNANSFPGLPPEQENSLVERNPTMTSGPATLGIELPNCLNAVIDNQS